MYFQTVDQNWVQFWLGHENACLIKLNNWLLKLTWPAICRIAARGGGGARVWSAQSNWGTRRDHRGDDSRLWNLGFTHGPPQSRPIWMVCILCLRCSGGLHGQHKSRPQSPPYLFSHHLAIPPSKTEACKQTDAWSGCCPGNEDFCRGAHEQCFQGRFGLIL